MTFTGNIEDLTSSAEFGAGRKLAASYRSLMTKQCDYSGSEVFASAYVASPKGWAEAARAWVSLDSETGEVLDYDCTCLDPDAPPCRHCVAVALSYQEEPQRFMGYRKQRMPETSAALRRLLDEEELNPLDPFGQPQTDQGMLAQPDKATVRLIPSFEYNYRDWSVTFKIADDRCSYVLKDIDEFADNLRTAAYYSYGKKLAFEHSLDAFEPESRGIAEFLQRASEVRASTSLGSFRMIGKIGREFHPSATELIELFDLLRDQEITISSSTKTSQRISHCQMVEGDPPLKLDISPAARGGFYLSTESEFVVVSNGTRTRVWLDDAIYSCSNRFTKAARALEAFQLAESSRLFIKKADAPLFFARMVKPLEEAVSLTRPPETDSLIPQPCNIEFYLDKTPEQVSCEYFAVYGEQRYQLPAASNKTESKALRNHKLEANADACIQTLFDRTLSIPLSDEHAMTSLLFGGMAELASIGKVFTTPAFDRLLFNRKVTVNTGLSLAGNLINLEVFSDELDAEELVRVLEAHRRKKRYHRLKSGLFLDMANFEAVGFAGILEDLGLRPSDLASGNVELPAYRAVYLDSMLENARRDADFSEYVSKIKAKRTSEHALPESLAPIMRDYQKTGFEWLNLIADLGFGGILADDMGLGKSLQLISFLLGKSTQEREGKPSLIVCPASLVYNWVAEFERFAPGLNVVAVEGTKAARVRLRNTPDADVLVVSYDLLRIDAKEFAQADYFCCALDEAHYIKNHEAKTTKAAKLVNARHRFALTGTPMENRLSELWSIFDFLMPGLLGSYMRFRERYEIPILGDQPDAAARLAALVEPFMLRRLKADVLTELPDKMESVVLAQFGTAQQKLYRAHEQRLRDQINNQKRETQANSHRSGANKVHEVSKVEILAELTKLRQICCDPSLLFEDYKGGATKVDTIAELVESAREAGHKTLIFSQFTSFLSVIASYLESKGIPFYTITGSTPKKMRLELVNAFNTDDTPVFLISLKAGGTGLNLTGASVVIHADPWWNASAQNQATDRAHRLGQDKSVSVYQVIAKGTIEERIVNLQQRKLALADQVIGASTEGGLSLATLSADDLLDLLEG